jgi:hypothetical protein
MKIPKSPCEDQWCENYGINPGCYRHCKSWQTWFRESWRTIQKSLGVEPKEEGET